MQGRTVWLALAILLALAMPAAAQPVVSRLINDTTLLLAPSERVTLRMQPSGRLALVSAVRIDPADVAPPKSLPPPTPGARNPLLNAPDGTIAFLYGVVGEDTLLRIENAMATSFDYRAALMEKSAPPARGELTSVCTVRHGLVGYEFWPQRRVPAIMLSAFALRHGGDGVCTDASGEPSASPAPAPTAD